MLRRRCLAILISLAAMPSARAADAPWVAKLQSMPRQIIAYATVEPRSVLRLRAGMAGEVANLTVLPGDTVSAHEVLGQLTGPTVEMLLSARQAALAGAEATLKGAQQELTIQQEKFAGRLATRGAVTRDVAALSNAQAKLDSARSALSAADDMATLRAPSAGRVLTVGAVSGERVAMGETVLTLVPEKDLWLRATVYGADANLVARDMTGEFTPAGGGPAIAVTVRTIVGALQPNAGRTVNLVSRDTATGWLDGETGTVTINAGKLSGVAVPTRALILDQARWWVLVRTPQGVHPQAVVPGPTRGWKTLIAQGLSPGEQVVVEDAYLEYHRGISQHYAPPD